MTEASRLTALVDGSPLDADAARALWTEFSAHMDEHRGDMAGFAKKKGWVSVAPEYRQGKAVLVVRTGAPMAEPKRDPRPKQPNRAQKRPDRPAGKPARGQGAPPPKKKPKR